MGKWERVKKGVYEEDVDATGGEIRLGCENYVQDVPSDPSETLLHITARVGNADMVEWLDSHGKFPPIASVS